MSERLVVTAARGVEASLVHELRTLGVLELEPKTGAVLGHADDHAAARVVFHSRVASRVLRPITTFELAHDVDVLYAEARDVQWEQWLARDRTFAVETSLGAGSTLHSHYAALRVKDAIVDRFRDRTGSRPSVDTKAPDVRFHLHHDGKRATLSLDIGNGSLHKRGYRPKGVRAPLKENLAAAILYIAGYPERTREGATLIDPMCGSGTLLVEAALMALDVAPGLVRHDNGGKRPELVDVSIWERLLKEARDRRAARSQRRPIIIGLDASHVAVAAARESANAAGVARAIRFEQRALTALSLSAIPGIAPGGETPSGGLLITNPPYGERLGQTSELVFLYEELGDVLRRGFGGFDAYVLTATPELAKSIGLRARRRHVLYNGPLECRLLELPIRREEAKSEGPKWRVASAESQMLANRLRKNAKHLERWARREGIEAYRVYDADIPEYNCAVDRYGGFVVLQEYARPRGIDDQMAGRRLRDARLVVSDVLEVALDHIVLKVRERHREGGQYEKRDDQRQELAVRERNARFLVNLRDYIDTGLYLDHREVRAMLAKMAAGKRLLNLYAYTCTASVQAALAGAATTSVDLSSTYLEWGRRNMRLNGVDPAPHRFERADCVPWLLRDQGSYDVVFANPPSYSRSKRMEGDLDLVTDHPALIDAAIERLAPDGVLLFSTHRRNFELDRAVVGRWRVEEVTARTIPEDFRRARKSPFRAWTIRRR